MTSVKNDIPYEKFAQGIFVVKAKNSSFNSDFSGLPRRLPDKSGTIYATDKALKYCIRKYLLDSNKGQVFVWRRYDDKSKPLDIDQNYKAVFKEDLPTREVKKKGKIIIIN
jgi:CRISPR-associated protein Csh2